MRFIEIANPEDQLALWKLVSDKMWAALGQPVIQQTKPLPTQQLVKSPTKAVAKPTSRTQAKSQGKRKTSPVKANKPKKAPMAPAPKPLPKPQIQQLTPIQASKQQTQQHQQLANHIHQALTKKLPIQTYSQKIQPKGSEATSEIPLNNSYSERDKDDLVMHRRQNPFKPLDIK